MLADYNVLISIIITSITLLKSIDMYLNKQEILNGYNINIEKYYSLYLKSLNDYKIHFSSFIIAKYDMISDNEVEHSEFDKLKSDFINGYIDMHNNTVMLQIITTHYYADINQLIKNLSKDFDIYFSDEYAKIKLETTEG